MPTIAAAAIVSSFAVTSAFAITAITIGVQVAFAYASSSITSALAKKKARGRGRGAEDSREVKQNIRSGVAPRRLAYGRCRLGGSIFLLKSTDLNIFVGIALCEGKIERIGTTWIGDKELGHLDYNNAELDKFSLTLSGNCTGIYRVTINEQGGSYITSATFTASNHSSQTVINQVMSSTFEFEGVNGLKLKLYQDGSSIICERSIGTSYDRELVITLLEGNVPFTVTRIAGKAATTVNVEKYTAIGFDLQSSILAITSQLPDYFTDSYRLHGIAYVVARFNRNFVRQDLGGIPEISTEIEGCADILDIRTGITGYSTNPVLCMRHFLQSDYFKSANGRIIDNEQMDNAEWIADANKCDEIVNGLKRYEMHGSFSYDSTIGEIVDAMSTSIQGELIEISGKYRFRPLGYIPPIHTITIDDLAGDWQITPSSADEDSFDAAIGTFKHVRQGYVQNTYPLVKLGATANNIKTIDFPLEIEEIRAQRIALLNLRVSSNKSFLVIEVKALDFILQPNESVNIDFDGFFSGVFLVKSMRRDNKTAAVVYNLIETTTADYIDDSIDNFSSIPIVVAETALAIN